MDEHIDLDNDPCVSEYVRSSAKKWSEHTDDMEHELDVAFKEYEKYLSRKVIFIAISLVICLVAVGVTLTIGALPISFTETYRLIWAHVTGNVYDEFYDYAVINLRMPSILTSVIAGSGLAVCGAVMQSVMKNPLADSYTTGVSSGAGFGASLGIVLGISILPGDWGLVANAFVFSLIPTAVIILVSRIKNTSPTVMIMAGIAVMYIFNACTTLVKLWADPDALAAVFRWQVGSVSSVTWNQIPVMAVVVIIGIIALQFLSGKINLLSTGDDNSKALGIDPGKLRILCLGIVAMVCAAVVCFTGLIGFVGLVAPHIVRIFIGPDNRYVIIASAAFGAALLLIAYAVGISLVAPAVLPVGVITSFLGGPMFLWLILRKNSRVWG